MHFPDVALVIEGGGMRNSYTGALVEKLMTQGVSFGFVCGVSAGASHTVNFLAGDPVRARESFVSIGAEPRIGGWGSFLRGRGFFDGPYIYEQAPFLGSPGVAPFDFAAFRSNPTPMGISAVNADTGTTVHWTRDDAPTAFALMQRVRASSTMPMFMTMPVIDGTTYVDGALGESGGIPIDVARAAGFRRFLVILSRPRSYVKSRATNPWVLRQIFRRHPAVAAALEKRPERYNTTRAELLDLEASGDAYLFFAKDLPVENRERRLAKLEKSYRLGRAQADAEWKDILRFLNG